MNGILDTVFQSQRLGNSVNLMWDISRTTWKC